MESFTLLILGVVITWGILLGRIGLLSYLVLAHFVALGEEEHLTRVYGQSYRDYCARVPRFIGLPKKGVCDREHYLDNKR